MTDSLVAALAPAIDEEWTTQFIIELRLEEVSGQRISSALAEVNDHISSDGRSASEIFGNPSEYAKSLHLPSGDTAVYGMRAIVPSVIGFMGMILTVEAVHSLTTKAAMTVSLGMSIGVFLIVGLMSILGIWGKQALRTLIHHPVFSALLGIPLMAILLLIMGVAPGPLGSIAFPVSPWPALCLGVIGITVATYLTLRLNAVASDKLAPPMADMATQALAQASAMNRSLVLIAWVYPIVTVILCLLLWLLP